MSMKFTQMQCKEVICVGTGERLGFVSDVVVELPDGCITAIVVPGKCKFLGLFGPQEDYYIPWCKICQVGPDIVLVDIKCADCRVPRPKSRFPF